MRTIWIAALAGGPFTYTGVPLHEAHQSFHLTAAEFNEVGAEIVRALDYYKVPNAEQQELVAAYNTAMLSFPNNLIAGPFGFTAQPFFEIQDAAQREAPQVKFT